MKLHNAQKEIKSGTVKYTGQWQDQMRRPARVKISLGKGPDVSSEPQVFLEGKAYDVSHALFAIADLAWKEGWRPAGLMESLQATVAKHQVPE